METTFYIDSLIYLSDFGIGQNADLKPILKKYIKIGTPVNDPEWVKNINNKLSVLKSMKTYGHINYDENQDLMNLLIVEGEYYVSITPKGYEYIDRLLLNKTLKNVNEASLINYRTQKTFQYITVVLAGLSALFSLFAYAKTDETAKSVDRLRQEVRQWRLEETKHQIQKAFALEKTHTP